MLWSSGLLWSVLWDVWDLRGEPLGRLGAILGYLGHHNANWQQFDHTISATLRGEEFIATAKQIVVEGGCPPKLKIGRVHLGKREQFVSAFGSRLLV